MSARKAAKVSNDDARCCASKPCLESGCVCCAWWLKNTGIDKILQEQKMTSEDANLAPGDSGVDATQQSVLQAIAAKVEKEKVLEENLKKTQQANKELQARANGVKIKTATAADPPKEKRRVGRPSGQPATKNKRPEHIDREQTHDCTVCPNCNKSDMLSPCTTDEYDRVAEIVHVIKEMVKFNVKRRWCRRCKKQVSTPIPKLKKYARHTSNIAASTISLNADGLSHAKAAAFCNDALGTNINRQQSYRSKISASKELAPERDRIAEEILKADYIQGDELHWPINGDRGHVLVAISDTMCLMKVSEKRKIEDLQKFLPGYKGFVGHDSYAAWLHIGKGCGHQMCLTHEMRMVKTDLKYLNPTGDVEAFLNEYLRLLKRIYASHDIKDPHTRKVMANCFDEELRALMGHNWDTKNDHLKIINKHRKRYRREGYFITTFLQIEGIDPDSNRIERTNRTVVSARNDGGGNRTSAGMEANSILFTVRATRRMNGESFFDLLQRSIGGG